MSKTRKLVAKAVVGLLVVVSVAVTTVICGFAVLYGLAALGGFRAPGLAGMFRSIFFLAVLPGGFVAADWASLRSLRAGRLLSAAAFALPPPLAVVAMWVAFLK
jgi:hypothetical protein